jgi:hypothetical protein
MDLDISIHVSRDGNRWTDAYMTKTNEDGQVEWLADVERGPFDGVEDLWLWVMRNGWRVVTNHHTS